MKSLTKKLKKNEKFGVGEAELEEDMNSDNELQDGFEAALASKPISSAWASGGHQRDHLLQLLLNLVSNFGVYHTTTPSSSETYDAAPTTRTSQDQQEVVQEVFFKNTYALENVNGLRQFLRDMEDPLTRDLMIQISKYKMMQRYIVPLFCLSLDDRTLAMPLIRLFLYLTKPLSTSKIESLQKDIRRRKGKETIELAAKRVEQEQSYRNNALQQAEALLSFKSSLVNEEVFEIILQHAAEPLLKEPELRTEDDKKVIECVLMLISNLLAIEPYSACSTAVIARAKEVQNKLVLALSDEFLGIILLLCQTIMDRVNRAWNLILVEVVSQLLKNRDPKDLLRAHQKLLQGPVDKTKPTTLAPPPIPMSGKLHDALARERAERNSQALYAGNRMNRFGGVFVVPSSSPAPSDGSGASASSRTKVPQIIRNPMALLKSESSRPQVNKKRSKRCFANSNQIDSIVKSSSFLSSAGGADEQRALLVLADFLETFLSSGFNELVYSVKEGWRREDPMKHTEELMYFDMITSCLRYERMKIQAAFRDRCNSVNEENLPWKPSLKNITQCFDRMSIMRPITTMASIMDVSKRYPELVIPMELFKELICFLRVMLESEDMAHNDIALGALHKIFYISYSDRMDPVNNLLRAWKPERYSRHHLEVLLELVHETMKLLDIADYCFKKESADDPEISAAAKKKNQKNQPVKDDERSQYLAAALKFDPHEYFRRLICTQTVRLYIRALELYASNSPQVNHHIFVFLQRMCSYRIEDDHSIKQANATDFQPGQVSLGHMLYNLPALSIFSTIINDPVALSDKHLEPLVRLIKGIVRRFGESAQRNRLLFVEILFPRNLLNWAKIESVYDAAQYAKGTRESAAAAARHTEGEEPETTAAAPSSDSEPTDSGEEFNEELDLVRVPVSLKAAGRQKKQTQRKRTSRGKGKESESDEAETEDSESGSPQKRRKTRRKRSPAVRQWSESEDARLRELYLQYAGSQSIFDTIAMHLGDDFTSKHVEERIKELQLHLVLSAADPDETYEQSLKYATESSPMNTSSLPWEASSSDYVAVDGGADGVAENEDEEDEKWKRVREVTKTKKFPARKLVKGRKMESKNDDNSEDEFGDNEESLPSAPLAYRESNPFQSSSVLLDSDDE